LLTDRGILTYNICKNPINIADTTVAFLNI